VLPVRYELSFLCYLEEIQSLKGLSVCRCIRRVCIPESFDHN
jgi:hypothetical protein